MVGAITATFDDLAVFSVWTTGLIGTVIAIVVVVWLIFGITRSVLVIDTDLDNVIGVGRRILNNTTPLFDLEKTAKLAETLRTTAAAIEDDARAVLSRAGATPPSAWRSR